MHNAKNKFIPTMQLPELAGCPSHDDLLRVVTTCERHPDKYVLQSWSEGIARQTFMLRALIVGSGQDLMRLKREGKAGQPEWAFIRGTDPDKNIVWVHMTGDVGLLFNLIAAEMDGQAGSGWQDDPVISQNRISRTNVVKVQPGHAPGKIDAKQGSMVLQQPGAPLKNPQAASTASLAGQSNGETPGAAQPAVADAGARHTAGGVVLSGDIRELELLNVLQSIGLCKMSGALMLNNNVDEASFYFNDGEIIDAAIKNGFSVEGGASDLRGEHAFLEVLTWENGTFLFDQQRKAMNTSITRKPYVLLMEGAMLRDHCQDLKNRGLDMDSRFAAARPELTDTEIDELLKQGLPLDVPRQKSVMERLKSGQPLYELLKQMPMPKAIWVPIVFNLLGLKLIALANESVKPADKPSGDVFQWEESLVSKFRHDLVRPDTGMCADAAFFYFVKRELLRFKKTGSPFCLLLFQIRYRRGTSLEPLTNEALRECANRFSAAMGDLDLIGHNNMLDFGILLLGESMVEAGPLLDACARIVTKPLLSGIESAEQLQITTSLYMPESDGRIILKQQRQFQKK